MYKIFLLINVIVNLKDSTLPINAKQNQIIAGNFKLLFLKI